MRVLLVTPYYPEHGGGVEIVAGEIAKRFVAEGVKLRWLASAEPGGTTAHAAEPLAAWNVFERKYGVPYPLWHVRAIGRVRDAVEWADAVHIHDCLYTGSLVSAFFARKLGKRLVVTQHIGVIPYRNRALSLLMAGANRFVGVHVLRQADAVVFISSNVESYWRRLALLENTKLVPNGVSRDHFFPATEPERARIRSTFGWNDSNPVFLFVGRFVEKKGLHVIRGLAESLPQALWVFAGWGSLDPGSWRMNNVRSYGRQRGEALRHLYQAADMLVLPSVGEGFPLVVQESMACGTPVVVSSETAAAMPGLEAHCWHTSPDVSSFRALLSDVSRETLGRLRENVAEFAVANWSWERSTHAHMELLRPTKRETETSNVLPQ